MVRPLIRFHCRLTHLVSILGQKVERDTEREREREREREKERERERERQ